MHVIMTDLSYKTNEPYKPITLETKILEEREELHHTGNLKTIFKYKQIKLNYWYT